MSGAIHPLPQYAFMALCSVKARGQLYLYTGWEVSGQLHAPVAQHPGKSPWYPSDKRLSEPQSRSGRGGEEKKSLDCLCQEISSCHPTCSVVTILTELPRLLRKKERKFEVEEREKRSKEEQGKWDGIKELGQRFQ
jgi:hypothetical protein